MAKGSPKYWLHAKQDLDVAFAKIKQNIDDVLEFLSEELPNVTLMYIKITPRPWWGFMARTLARWVDYYVLVRTKPRFKFHQVWIHELFNGPYHLDESPMPGMLCTDQVHMNSNGHKAFVHGLMRPLLHMWRARYRPGRRRRAQINMNYFGKLAVC